MDDQISVMQHDEFSTKLDENDSFTDSFNYNAYEREQRREQLLSSTRNREIEQDAYDSTSPSETEPINNKDASYDQTTPISLKQRIVVMIACIYINCAYYSLIVSLGIIYVQIIEVFDTSRADAALIQSLYMGTALGGAVLFAKLFECYNPGYFVIVASMIGTASTIGGSFAESITTLVVLLGVILGIVMSCNLLASFVTVARVFTTNRQFSLAVLTMGQTIGQISTPFVTYALVENYSWNGALLVLSGLTTLNCLPCGLVMMCTLKSTDRVNVYYDKPRTVSLFKDPLFYFFVFSFFTCLLFGPVEQWFSADMAVMKGFTYAEGSRLLSVNGGAEFTGRFLGAMLVRIFKNVRTEIYLVPAFITWAVGHYTLYLATKYWISVLCITLRGLSAGLVIANVPVMQLELVGLSNFAMTMALCNCVGGIGETLGGYIGGLTVDITGNYHLLFILAAFSALYCAGSYIVVYCVRTRRIKVTSHLSYSTI